MAPASAARDSLRNPVVALAKYDPLGRYLRRQSGIEVTLTFPEIENLLVALLPKSARRREWWANEAADSGLPRQSLVWLPAGYLAYPAIGEERVMFRRRSETQEPTLTA